MYCCSVSVVCRSPELRELNYVSASLLLLSSTTTPVRRRYNTSISAILEPSQRDASRLWLVGLRRKSILNLRLRLFHSSSSNFGRRSKGIARGDFQGVVDSED